MTLKTDLYDIVNGANKATNFSSQLMRIVFKADMSNRAKLHTLYPNLVRTVQHWKDTDTEEILDLPYD